MTESRLLKDPDYILEDDVPELELNDDYRTKINCIKSLINVCENNQNIFEYLKLTNYYAPRYSDNIFARLFDEVNEIFDEFNGLWCGKTGMFYTDETKSQLIMARKYKTICHKEDGSFVVDDKEFYLLFISDLIVNDTKTYEQRRIYYSRGLITDNVSLINKDAIRLHLFPYECSNVEYEKLLHNNYCSSDFNCFIKNNTERYKTKNDEPFVFISINSNDPCGPKNTDCEEVIKNIGMLKP